MARRKNWGVEDFRELKAAWKRGPEAGRAALMTFHQSALARVQSRLDAWEAVVREGFQAEAAAWLEQIHRLKAGDWSYLGNSAQLPIRNGGFRTVGFCGTLCRLFGPATLAPGRP